MTERPVVFGRTSKLSGILVEPEIRSAPGAPAVIFLNAGLLHRVGPHRLYVKLARAFAARGIPSLRFDQSGLGDSEVRRDAVPSSDRGPLETAEAMDYMESTVGTNAFVLVGLCSGAFLGLRVACDDPRVMGLIQLQGYIFRTWRYYLWRFGPKLLSPTSVIGFVTSRAAEVQRLWQRRADSGQGDFVAGDFLAPTPARTSVATGLQKLADRGAQMFFFYSGTEYTYSGQFEDCFSDVAFRGKLRVEYMKAADHTISDIAHQEALVAMCCEWIETWAATSPLATADLVDSLRPALTQ